MAHNRYNFVTRPLYAAVLLSAFIGLASLPSGAQQIGSASPAVPSDQAASVEKRIQALESQLELLQAELERMRAAMNEKNAGTSGGGGVGAVESRKPVSPPPSAAAAASKESLQAQPKQTGIDLGGVRAVPYGTVYLNAFNNSRGVNNQDVPLFATPTGQGGTSTTVRQTRLGVRFEGAKIGNARLSGVVEADFFGGIPAVGIGENFGVVRVRLANARLDWEKTSVTVGQDWMPFAPVNPTSLAAAAIPQMAASGNNWARIPQVRVDRKLSGSVTLTGAVLAPQTGDHPTASTFFLQPTTGSSSHIPFLQSRITYAGKDWLGTKKAGSIGLSGHYGRSRVGVSPDEVDSYGVAADWSFPLHKRVSLAGEGFFGRALGGFQAGIFQGVNTEFAYRSGAAVRATGSRGIATKGGWTQIGFTPDVLGDRWTVYGSIGLDDPRDSDLTSVSRFNFRTRNLAYALNTIFKVTPQFSIGAEIRRFETSYFNTGKSRSEHFNLSAAYSF